MQGHAVSNCMPVIAANRIGAEGDATFYGHSFITDEWGDMTQAFGGHETGVLVETLDLDRAAKRRAGTGFFRDHRPQLYERLVVDICSAQPGRRDGYTKLYFTLNRRRHYRDARPPLSPPPHPPPP